MIWRDREREREREVGKGRDEVEGEGERKRSCRRSLRRRCAVGEVEDEGGERKGKGAWATWLLL